MKTRVDGNKITFDDIIYTVEPAGAEYYSVHNEFGQALGYLRIRGRAITVDDYRLDGAPPLMQIGKVWLAANESIGKRPALPSKGVCHVVVHEGVTDEQLDAARTYRAWLKHQPGLKVTYLARDPSTGKAMSVSIWQSRAQLDAALAATDADGTPLPAASTEIFPFTEDPPER